MLKGIEWVYFVLCIAFCVYAFVDREYVMGGIFTVLTALATVNTIRSNLKKRENSWYNGNKFEISKLKKGE